jgi:hypothetical protein
MSELNSCASLGHQYNAPELTAPSSVAPLNTKSRRLIIEWLPGCSSLLQGAAQARTRRFLGRSAESVNHIVDDRSGRISRGL